MAPKVEPKVVAAVKEVGGPFMGGRNYLKQISGGVGEIGVAAGDDHHHRHGDSGESTHFRHRSGKKLNMCLVVSPFPFLKKKGGGKKEKIHQQTISFRYFLER